MNAPDYSKILEQITEQTQSAHKFERKITDTAEITNEDWRALNSYIQLYENLEKYRWEDITLPKAPFIGFGRDGILDRLKTLRDRHKKAHSND